MSAPQILVIEDNPGDVQLLRHSLNLLGELYELIVLRDGQAALAFIDGQRTGKFTEPCVIVLDLHIPKHDGMAILRAIRQDPVMGHISVVVLTSMADPKDQIEVSRLGAHFSEKPMDLADYQVLAGFILDLCKRHLEAIA